MFVANKQRTVELGDTDDLRKDSQNTTPHATKPVHVGTRHPDSPQKQDISADKAGKGWPVERLQILLLFWSQTTPNACIENAINTPYDR